MDPNANPLVRQLSTDSTTIEAPNQNDTSALPTLATINEKTDSTDVRAEGHDAAIDPEDQFPEGGLRAWSVVAGAMLLLYPSFGFMVSIGPVQDYLNQNQLSDYSSRDVGWIPSVFVYLALALGIWIGPLFDRYGPRWIALIGSVGLACVAHWFKERRGLTQGIAMIGSSFGGLTIPLILRATFPRYGYQWSMRILGFTFLACFVMGNILMRARIPPRRHTKIKVISLSIFGDLRFSLLTVAIFCFEVVLFGALGIVPTYATISTDYPADTGFYLISTMNGVSSIGRLVTGYFSDKFGRFNTLLVSAVVALIVMLAIWLPFGQHNLGALYGFIAIFGFMTGCWMALVPACIGQLCRADEFGKYYGTSYFIASLSTLVCIPISGELLEVVGAQALVAFFCAILAMGTVTFAASRWACLRWKWDWTSKV
ncbi:hypothetical protein LTR70_006607 [Exophiala xenobiotica]|uniref:Major facilitator superfamily (MFS) profile domain-containing protein n=1 Tax=Lithohypha guttulata TaxID=1690604 RepID=A0ABR0K802_9EURO|nr:hypothetical protein LTR24_005926 [Lithohypha guttulata]KAK5315865.1 hypothetical protein LTR70_006607 [Exophiala xenobiotica]